jgi:hypothetical protein
MWALRDAVIASGHGRSGAEAMAFYARMAREIDDACDRGVLEAGPHRNGFLPPLPKGSFGMIVNAFRGALAYVVYFDDISVETPPSVGPAERLRSFADISRGRLAPPEGAAPIPPKQRWLDRIRLKILDRILRLYPWISPWAGFGAALVLVAASAIALIRRRLPYFLILSCGALVGIMAIAAIDAMVEITSFHGINAAYLTGAYGLWLLFIFTSFLALANAMSHQPQPRASILLPGARGLECNCDTNFG